MKLELIGFKPCPYAQRVAILLLEKNVEFTTTYINPQELPPWFKEISPTGKVPILKVDDDALFESAVICEFIDEALSGQLHPAEPVHKAKHRAWVEYISGCLGTLYQLAHVKEQAEFEEQAQQLENQLQRLEETMDGSYFGGETISMVDVALAPLLMRLDFLRQYGLELLDCNTFPKLCILQKTLLEKESVKQSIVPELPEMYKNMLKNNGGYAGTRID